MVIKPTRAEIAEMTGPNPRLLRAMELLFSVLTTTTADLGTQAENLLEVIVRLTDAEGEIDDLEESVALILSNYAQIPDGISAGDYLRWDGTSLVAVQPQGWAQYFDDAAPQVLVAATPATLSINSGSVVDSQKPSDVSTFWDATGNIIVGRNNEVCTFTVSFTFTPSDAVASNITADVDVGGVTGVIRSFSFDVTTSTARDVVFEVTAPMQSDWVANGAKITVEADGPGALSEKTVFISRIFKP